MHLLWHMLARPVTLQDSLRHTCCLSVHMAVPKVRVVVVVVLGVDVIVGMSMGLSVGEGTNVAIPLSSQGTPGWP